MKSANWLGHLLKVLGLSVLALVAYVAFYIYAANHFWGNSEITVTSEQQGGLSVSLTHPAVVKSGGNPMNPMTMTVFNHTSEPVTVAEPFLCFFGNPEFIDSHGQQQQTADNLTCPMIGMPPITIPARSSKSGKVWLYTEGLPADTYKVTYEVPLSRLADWESPSARSSEVTLNVSTGVRVVPWWRLF